MAPNDWTLTLVHEAGLGSCQGLAGTNKTIAGHCQLADMSALLCPAEHHSLLKKRGRQI
jgi:hypothetical protein